MLRRALSGLPSMAPTAPEASPAQLQALAALVGGSNRLLAVTGAGISTHSGIPDYRSPNGSYSRGHKPITHQEFTKSEAKRRRYWARSFVGFRSFGRARPNAAHLALSSLESAGLLHGGLITQNVDGLHEAAGSVESVDLHGRIDRVECLNCGASSRRDALQLRLREENAQWLARHGLIDPEEGGPEEGGRMQATLSRDRRELQRADGDWELDDSQVEGFAVPACEECGGMLKPAVVFFGGSIPQSTVELSKSMVAQADALLVVGSSLQVFSAFRLARQAAAQRLPIAILNVGET